MNFLFLLVFSEQFVLKFWSGLICNAVSDGMVYQFLSNPPVSSYFSDLVQSLKDQCTRLDSIVHDKEYVYSSFNQLYHL